MHKECLNCDSHRMCINGIYCNLLKRYVQYSTEQECKKKKQAYENKGGKATLI